MLLRLKSFSDLQFKLRKGAIGLLLWVGLVLPVLGLHQVAFGATSKEVYDPLEPWNRAVFSFNLEVEKALLRPIAKGYEAVTPEIVQDRVSDFLGFLKTPLTLVNNLLQGDLEGAANTTARFMVNGTIGLLGFIDVMEEAVPPRDEDFGQTLAVWGVPSGNFMMLPILGPSTLRDTAGRLGEGLADPMPEFIERND